jgi:hypothetical protein
MLIGDWKLNQKDHKKEISAAIDGFNLWYRVPDKYKVSRNGEPFLAAALIPAMLKGESIDLHPSMPVSEDLLANLGRLQEVYHKWNRNLKIIKINASLTEPETLNDGMAAYFSGGVDSSYTRLKLEDIISHVLYISGFDFPCEDSIFEKMIERNKLISDKFGKEFVEIETNFYQFGYTYDLSRNLTQGSCLGSVALLLSFNSVYIPSSYSYDQLFPLGSHPITDPHWSNGSYDIIHDGCEATRTEKIKKLLADDTILNNLSVCLKDSMRNCGQCQKCIRTMISLKLLNAETTAFPVFPSLKEISKRKIDGQLEATFLRENIELADQVGNLDLKKALQRSMKRYEKTGLLKQLDKVFLGGKCVSFYKRFLKEDDNIVRIDLDTEFI